MLHARTQNRPPVATHWAGVDHDLIARVRVQLCVEPGRVSAWETLPPGSAWSLKQSLTVATPGGASAI